MLRIRVYRTGGILLIVLTLALSAAVVQMVYANRAFEYAGLMIYASAAYAFYKIIMALYNLVKARKQSDFKIRAVRNINFADAAVSVLALQTAMVSGVLARSGREPLQRGHGRRCLPAHRRAGRVYVRAGDDRAEKSRITKI